MNRLACIATILILSGCASEADNAYEAFRQTMFDPEAARFRNFEQVGSTACFEVNGRNRFGGYTGYQTVLAIKTENGEWVGEVISETPSSSSDIPYQACVRSLSRTDR